MCQTISASIISVKTIVCATVYRHEHVGDIDTKNTTDRILAGQSHHFGFGNTEQFD